MGPPGHNGTRGPQGPPGSQGPPGPRGAGNFSSCTYGHNDADKAQPGVTAKSNVSVQETGVR